MNISILGLGWLGKPLADSLLDLGFVVKGSTTSVAKLNDLKAEGYNVYKVQIEEKEVYGNVKSLLKDSEILILNTPPGLRRNPESNYVAKIKQLIPYIENSSVRNVLFIGSTSVFADTKDMLEVTNEMLPNSESSSAKQLIRVERILSENVNFKTTILRFAGLVDERRHPATMMSKRKQIPNPLAPVNLIHRSDCVGIIREIISGHEWGKIYNAAYPLHPSKETYYTNVCTHKKLPLPNFIQNEISKGKLINGEKTANELSYKYNHSILKD